MLLPDNFSAAYLPRHWACAIDVVEMVATLGDCSQPEVAGAVGRWDKTAWNFMSCLLPVLNEACNLSVNAGSLTLRQAWGLTVRSERAIRAAAPHWGALEAGGWGELAEGICLNTSRFLVDEVPSEAWSAEDTAVSLLQLLTSNTATLLKLARYAGRMDSTLLQTGMMSFHDVSLRCSVLGPACPHAITVAGPTIFFLLAPRHIAYAIHAAPSWSDGHSDIATSVGLWLHWVVALCCALIPCTRLSLLALTAQPLTALLHLVVEVGHSTEWITPEVNDGAIAALSNYAAAVAERVHQLASQGCHEGAAAGSSQLRDMLAQPVLCLLGSSLMDQLALLQHSATESIGQFWLTQYCAGLVPPLNCPDEADIAVHQVSG